MTPVCRQARSARGARSTLTIKEPEFLIHEDQARHNAVIAQLRQRFHLAPFDIAAAAIAARIWQQAQATGAYPDLRADGLTRQVIKVDTQILAVALAHSATVLYTEDPGVQKLAERVPIVSGRLVALPVPIPDRQTGLFD